MPEGTLTTKRTPASWRQRRRSTEVLIGRLLWAGLFAVVVWLGA